MSGRREPKWAWWVVGIVIPIIGIAVTIWAAGSPASDTGAGSDTATATGTARSPAEAGPAAPDADATKAPQGSQTADTTPTALVRSITVMLEPGLNYLDLDTMPPAAAPSADGADLVALFDAGDPGLVTEGATPTLARLSDSDGLPTPAECEAALKEHGSHDAGAPTVGSRFCVRTDEGRLAYLEIVLGVPIEPHVRLKATVWA